MMPINDTDHQSRAAGVAPRLVAERVSSPGVAMPAASIPSVSALEACPNTRSGSCKAKQSSPSAFSAKARSLLSRTSIGGGGGGGGGGDGEQSDGRRWFPQLMDTSAVEGAVSMSVPLMGNGELMDESWS